MKTETITIYVVTFEGEGSSGFNWFYNAAHGDRNYEHEQIAYSEFDEKTTVTRFDVEIPFGGVESVSKETQQQNITKWLEANDVWAFADKADQRAVVGKRGEKCRK